MPKILLIEDDLLAAETLREALIREVYVVDIAHDGPTGLEFLRSADYDLAVIDWQLPGLDGVEVCRRYRQEGGQTPIIMLTAKSSVDDKEYGFDAGADDYQTKPYEIRELRARIKSLLRRPMNFTGDVVALGRLTVDRRNCVVKLDDRVIQFHPTEFSLLDFFIKHPNQILSPETLLQRVWSTDKEASLQAVYACIKRVRQKIDPTNREALIKTVHGLGYRLIPPP